jgi:flagellar M-ring protein FliF
MSFLEQTTGQVREAFAAMPMQSRIISVMLAAAIAIGLGFLVQGDNSAGKEYLFGGRSFAEQELDSVELAFSRAGLSGYERDGRRMKIPSESKADYLAALEEASTLPASLRSSVQEAINATNIFDSSDLLTARVSHAKERDLATKINLMSEVRTSSVEYDRSERRGLSRSRSQSASVLVQPEGTAPLSRKRILDIKDLVRASYADMSIDDVVVIDTNSTTSASGYSDDDDPLERKRREVESRIEQKVRALLMGYPVRVAVTADIDPTMDVEKISTKYDAEPTNLSNKTRKLETSSNRQPNGGVPGAGPNAITNRSAKLKDSLETNESKEDERETSGVVGQQYENSRMASLQVKAVRVSVMLPTNYYEHVHVQEELKNDSSLTAADVPAIDDTDLERIRAKTKKSIQAAITPLLPEFAAGADQFPSVVVTDYPELPGPPPPEPQTTKLALTWLADSWQTIALIMLGLAALLVARSAAKGASDSAPTEFNEGFGLELPTPPPELEDQSDEGDSMTITGGSLKDELLALVEGNPEVAANVIRGWVGEAI